MSSFRLPLVASIGAAAIAIASQGIAQDWPHWRGPNYDGSATATDLPVKFTRTKHVAWKCPMPGKGASTPIVIGDRIFLTSIDSKRGKLVVMCVNRKTGKIDWQKDAGKSKGGGGGRMYAPYACPSATTDGKDVVVFFFGDGNLLGFDLDGQQLWKRNIQKDYGDFAFQWTFSASPTIWDGSLFLPVLQRDIKVRGRGGKGDGKIESFILAMEPKTGKTIYKHVRPSPAKMESLESYATIIPYVGKKGRKEFLMVGGDVLTGHDPETGKELWRWGTWNKHHNEKWWRLVPTVVVGGDVAVVCAPKRAPVYAVKLGLSGTVAMADGMAWKSEGRQTPVSSDVPSPAYHDGHFYVLSDVRNAISKVQAKDGKVVWTTRLSRDFKWRASPTIADGKLYVMNHNGEVVVMDPENGKALHHAFMGGEDDDHIRSSVVAAHNSLFIRTNDMLYCVRKEATKKAGDR